MGHDDPSTEIVSSEPVVEAAGAGPTLIGRSLGRFTLIERLGKGGSGEVFRAEQPQLGRSAVVKVLRHEVAQARNRVERFLREAQLASRLDHPYAAHIYAFGAEPDGVLWIAMEHVKGMTLDELVARRGPIPAGVFGPLFGRLCEVIHTAHELGIIHRDIKGGNVMVIERAGQLLPKLLDFGIAKAEGEVGETPGVDDTNLTGHGTTLGSPHYMSPEQWQRPSEVDARSDVYALGVLAYRCVAGWLPFRTLERHQLADAHLHMTPPALPDSVPPLLADAIQRALAKQPDARWQTAIEFAKAIRHTTGTAAVEAVPLFDPGTREAWLRAGPQPIADAVAHLTSATTTVEADAALRELVAITCRWLAVLALSTLQTSDGSRTSDPGVREGARAVIGRDDGAPWLRLARAAVAASKAPLPGLAAAVIGSDALGALADRLDDRDRPRTAATLSGDVASASDALRSLEPLLAYHLVVGGSGAVAESWQGTRRRDRERVLVWGESLREGEVALLDAGGRVVARLSPLAQVIAPLPSAEPELFLLWRSGRGPARLVAAPWGFECDDDAAGLQLAALSTEDSDTAADPAGERSPYPGLAAYGVADAQHFVGREREIEALANRLVRTPMIAVLGPSGVGKSSFIHAGVIPRLGEQHRILTLRPGRHPMHALAALPAVSGDTLDGASIVARLRELGESAQRGVVIVVDQLEELVTLCGDPDERRRFAETLAAAADGPSAPVRIVATLRDDFATVIESEAAFRGCFEVFVLATPPPEALRRIVREPARQCAVTVDPRVVDDMVAEVAGRPASLPLLSFTGSQLWETRDRAAHAITHAAYLAIGGVAGALATYADEIFARLARRDQETLRDIFARLVAADGTRIPSPRAELEQVPGAPGVLAHLIDARLLVVRDDDGGDVIEIVHECLAERWPRLARWRSEDAADRAVLGDVRLAARRWYDAGERADLLWRGEALAELRRLAAHSSALTLVERGFAEAAVAAEQRARRLRRGIVAAAMVVLASVAVVMAYLGVVANHSRSAAEHSESEARASATLAEDRLTASLVAQGRRELNDGRAYDALAYFAAAMRRGADTQGLRVMVTIASRAWRDELAVVRGVGFGAIDGSPAGWIAACDADGKIWFWSDTGASLGQIAAGAGPITVIHRLADDSLIVSGREAAVIIGADHHTIVRRQVTKSPALAAYPGPAAGELTVVERDGIRVFGPDGAIVRTAPFASTRAGAGPMFDSSGRHMIVGNTADITVIDLVTMQPHVIAHDGVLAPTGALDGSVFAYIDRKHAVHVFTGDGTLIRTLHPTAPPDNLVFSRTGDRLAAIAPHDLTIYDARGKERASYPIDNGEAMLVIRDDDAWLGGSDGVIRHYHRGDLVASLPVHPTEIEVGAIAGAAFAAIGSDSSIAIVRAAATQLEMGLAPCADPTYGTNDIGVAYTCAGMLSILVGRHPIGEFPIIDTLVTIDLDPVTARGVISGEPMIEVYDKTKVVARTTEHKGPAKFDDSDHLFVLEPRKALWRWTFASDHWDRLVDVGEAFALGAIPGTALIGGNDGKLRVVTGGREVATIDCGQRIVFVTVSPDHRWVAAQLADGATAIVDSTTWQRVRVLAGADNYGGAPTFDATGELLLRTSRGAMTIWDRSTGEDLVFGFDLLRNLANARFLPDGRIETDGTEPGLLDLPRDVRPIPQILKDIDCKVPLTVTGSRIEPATTTCR